MIKDNNHVALVKDVAETAAGRALGVVMLAVALVDGTADKIAIISHAIRCLSVELFKLQLAEDGLTPETLAAMPEPERSAQIKKMAAEGSVRGIL